MEIVVDRYVSDEKATISRILVDGKQVCYGLEDEYRAEKVAKETRIPAGQYPVVLRQEGRQPDAETLDQVLVPIQVTTHPGLGQQTAGQTGRPRAAERFVPQRGKRAPQ